MNTDNKKKIQLKIRRKEKKHSVAKIQSAFSLESIVWSSTDKRYPKFNNGYVWC